MPKEIINRVANSKLITVDLEDFYPKGERVLFDLSDWLKEGLILIEKDFRNEVKNHDWSIYNNKFVALYCSTDAIIPSWAYLLLTTALIPFAKIIAVGDLELLENLICQNAIKSHSFTRYHDKPVIIKGCSDPSIPLSAYTFLASALLPVVSSLMFGEACSNVPLYKK